MTAGESSQTQKCKPELANFKMNTNGESERVKDGHVHAPTSFSSISTLKLSMSWSLFPLVYGTAEWWEWRSQTSLDADFLSWTNRFVGNFSWRHCEEALCGELLKPSPAYSTATFAFMWWISVPRAVQWAIAGRQMIWFLLWWLMHQKLFALRVHDCPRPL